MLPVIAAVGAAHARGIVHRDLKPENIFLATAANGGVVPKVLDFGIAKILDPAQINELSTKTGATRTGSMLGTPHYMSIEQACGERDIDHRTDIWSIGVMLYVMLSGRRPYDGDNYGQILKALMTQTPAPIAELVPGLPSDVADLIGRCMARTRTERPIDLREVYGVLSAYTADTTVAPPPSAAGSLLQTDLATGATLAAASMYTSQAPSSQVAKPSPRRRNALVLVVVGLAALSIGAGLTVWKLSGPTPVAASPDPGPSAAAASSVPLSVPPPDSAIVISPTQPAEPASASLSSDSPPKTARGKSSGAAPSPATATGKASSPATATDGKPPKGGIIETVPY